MNRFHLTLLTFLGAASISWSAFAHHSGAAFDFMKPKTTQGVVKEFAVANPHLHAVLVIEDGKGMHDCSFEGVSASILYRAGYTRGMVKPGDRITIMYAPRRDGAEGGHIIGLVTAAGKRLNFSQQPN